MNGGLETGTNRERFAVGCILSFLWINRLLALLLVLLVLSTIVMAKWTFLARFPCAVDAMRCAALRSPRHQTAEFVCMASRRCHGHAEN